MNSEDRELPSREVLEPQHSSSDNPWPGLASYTERDSAMFFGRERETADLLRLIDREALTVVFGRSGLGKTSLLRAGVIPQLQESAFFPTFLRLDYPDKNMSPVEQLKAVCRISARAAGLNIENDSEDNHDATLWEFFHTVEFWSPRNDLLTPVLLIDQFEEVFTIGRNLPPVSEFLEQLADLIENRIPRSVRERVEQSGQPLEIDTESRNYKIVLSLREDFVSKLDSLRSTMPAIMRNRFALNPLSGERALSVIIRAGGSWVSEDVARDIVAAVAGRAESGNSALEFSGDAEIEPAYLSVMCHELFQRMASLGRSTITHDLVVQEHGNILEGLYERSFEGLNANVRFFVEDRLLTASGYRAAVPVPEALAEGISAQDLDKLVDGRLLCHEDRLGTQHIELSHDLLTGVVRKSRDQRRAQQEREEEQRRAGKLRSQLRHSRRKTMLAAAAAVVTLSALIFVYFAFFHEQVVYSNTFIKRFGRVEPVGRIWWFQTFSRSSTLRFKRKGMWPTNRWLLMEAIDGYGNLTTNHSVTTYMTGSDPDKSEREKECRWEFNYDKHGRVVSEIALDRFHRMVWGLIYAPDSTSSTDHPESAKAMFVGPDGYPQPLLHARAEYINIDYNDHGYEIRHRYSNRRYLPAPGPDNAYGRTFAYWDNGLPKSITSIDINGAPMNDKAGNATETFEYNASAQPIRTMLLDTAGNPTQAAKGKYAGATYVYDRVGNLTEFHYLDSHGKPAADEETGASIEKFKFDNHGNLIQIAYFNGSDSPVDIKEEEFFYQHMDMSNDGAGHRTSEAYFHAESKAVFPQGWHKVEYAYDVRGFKTKEIYLDANDHLVDIHDGYAQKEVAKDAFNQTTQERYWHADNSPALYLPGQYHIVRNVYDAQGNLKEQSYYGVNGQPVPDAVDGGYKDIFTYDRFRNVTSSAYYDANGSPMTGKAGFHKYDSTYDAYGNQTSLKYFLDKDGKQPAKGPSGFFEMDTIYDTRGLLKRIVFKNKNMADSGDENLRGMANSPSGIAYANYTHDDKQNQTSFEYFDDKKLPVNDGNGVHREEKEFDSLGRLVRWTQLDKDGKGAFDKKLGIATMRKQYYAGSAASGDQGAPQGKDFAFDDTTLKEQSFFDVKGKLAVGLFGFAKAIIDRNADGTLQRSNIGPDGHLMLNRLLGWAREVETYQKDKLLSDTYYGVDGSLINGPEGFAIHIKKLDSSGNLLHEEYLDSNRKPTFGPEGHSERTIKGNKDTYQGVRGELLDHPQDVVKMLYVNEITSLDAEALKDGMRVGDTLWALGNWSYATALPRAMRETKTPDEVIAKLWGGFKQELAYSKQKPQQITVLRDGRMVKMRLPVIPSGLLGIRIGDRSVPRAYYEQTLSHLR